MRKLLLVLACLGFVAAGGATAAPITQGALSVNINDTNGAINNAAFAGIEYYRNGTFVSDFGFQLGTTTSTFRVNDTNGTNGIPVTVTPVGSTVVVSGTFNGVSFVRTYSAVPGFDVLRTTTTLTNTTGATITGLRYFDTFDPDQGTPQSLGPTTTNDVTSLVGIPVATATAGGDTVILGGVGGRVGFLNSLEIDSGTKLNDFFANPIIDPNGASSDIGTAIGFEFTLGAGQSTTVSFDQAFGTSPQNAQDAFIGAQAIPEPTTMAAFALMGVAGFGYVRRRLKAAPVA